METVRFRGLLWAMGIVSLLAGAAALVRQPEVIRPGARRVPSANLDAGSTRSKTDPSVSIKRSPRVGEKALIRGDLSSSLAAGGRGSLGGRPGAADEGLRQRAEAPRGPSFTDDSKKTPPERPPVVPPIVPPTATDSETLVAIGAGGSVGAGFLRTPVSGPADSSGTLDGSAGGDGASGSGAGGDGGGQASGGDGGQGGGGGTQGPAFLLQKAGSAPRFRHTGVAIGTAVDVQQTANTIFPLSLSLTFDPLELDFKGVDPQQLEVFFFEEASGSWSSDGVSVTAINPLTGVVEFETTHLTVFRLGVSRGNPPLLHQLQPLSLSPEGVLTGWGHGFAESAAQNALFLGGAYVGIALTADGIPQTLSLADAGETLLLENAAGQLLDQAQLSTAPLDSSSWTRTVDGLASSAFLAHSELETGGLFSPGARGDGGPFVFIQGVPRARPLPGDLIINEVLLSPPATFLGDANGDGETDPLEDEFIELVNTSSHPLDLSGCRLITSLGERHRFAPGTILPGGMAYVVFGADDIIDPPRPSGPFGGIRIFPDETTSERFAARLPRGLSPSTVFLTLTRSRQTSNPLSLQVLKPLGDAEVGFKDASEQVPSLQNANLRFLRVGDLDRDKDLDVVGVGGRTDVFLLENDGFGRFFATEASLPLPTTRNRFFDAALADLTDDGAPELVIGDTDASGSYTQLMVFGNQGGGVFELLSSVGVLSPRASQGPAVLALGDADRDGDLDVVVGLIGDSPLLFRNEGQGEFAHTPQTDRLPQEDPVVPTALEWADVDADGDLDVVLAASRAGLGHSADVQLFQNDRSGGFADVTALQVPHHSDGVDAMAVGDINGDNALDIVIGGRTGPTGIFRNNGSGSFVFGSIEGLGSARPHSLSLGDLDGDLDLDLVLGLNPRDIAYLNDGTGAFQQLSALPENAGDANRRQLFDVDGDGDLDVMGAGPGLWLAINTGTRINRPPLITPIAEQSVIEGELLQVQVRAEDLDEDPIALSMKTSEGEALSTIGARFTDLGSGEGRLDWTPGADQGELGGRVYNLKVFADDGEATGEATMRVLVHNLNHPPVIAPIPNQEVDELSPLVLDVGARTEDQDPGDVLTFSGIGIPAGASLDSASGLFQWTPGPTAGDGPGGRLQYPVTFVATDLAGESDEEPLTVTVRNVNHAPVFTSPNPQQQVEEGSRLAFQVSAEDPDSDPLTLGVLALPPGAVFNPNNGLFEWTPTFLQGRAEPYVARFGADDGTVVTVLEVLIQVGHVNRPPAFVGLIDRGVEEGQTLTFEAVAQDPDNDPLTFDALGLPAGALFNRGTHVFAWTPTAAQIGEHNVIFEVSDSIVSVRQSVRLTVVDINHAPALGPIDDQTVREGHLLQIGIPVTDADGDALSVRVLPLPEGARVFRQGEAWIFQWVPAVGQSGQYPLTAEVTDGIILQPLTETFTVRVLDNPGFQQLVAQTGIVERDSAPLQTPLGALGSFALVKLEPGTSLGLDLGEVHPAVVSELELFHSRPECGLSEADLSLLVSDDNISYRAYEGAVLFGSDGNRCVLSGLAVSERYIKLHRVDSGDPNIMAENFLPDMLRASGSIPFDAARESFLDDLSHKTFLYFAENVNANGLIPDRVAVGPGGVPVAGDIYSTGTTGFWLASLPIAVERGWLTREQAEAFAHRTLEFYLGRNGGPVAGSMGFYYHFIKGDGSRYSEFNGDGVSVLDSTLLFAGALACAEYFDGELTQLAMDLYDRADWDAFFDHDMNMLRLFWTPEGGFVRHLDYTSEGMLAYILAAGAELRPITPDPDLPVGSDGYYAYSEGNFGRVLGRFGRDGKPLIQTFFGSLFSYLYPPLFVDLGEVRDVFHINWEDNAREAVLANFRFAQEHPAFGYGRLFWGISASDGPDGYQGLYGTPPLDPGAFGETHDGTVAPYALAGSLPFAADLSLPALEHLAQFSAGRLMGRYGLRSGVNVVKDFFDPDYLGLDQGALLLGVEDYRSGLIAKLVRQSAPLQRAFTALELHSDSAVALQHDDPRSRHAYVHVNTTDRIRQRVALEAPDLSLAGEALIELHAYGMDDAHDEGFVDVELSLNGEFLGIVRFLDRRGTGIVDVGSVYVPVTSSLWDPSGVNHLDLQWVGGERWLQLEDIEVVAPTGRGGTQETWQVGVEDASADEFANERRVDDSHIVGESAATLERALNVVDEPLTDILFELADETADRQLQLSALLTQDGLPVTVEVRVNDALVGAVVMRSGESKAIALPRAWLQTGWNHLRLRHAGLAGDGQFIVWDALAFSFIENQSVQVTLRNVSDGSIAQVLRFGTAPAGGAVLGAQQYLEIGYDFGAAFARATIHTDNRNAPIHRFTGPPEASAAGLVGEVDSTIVAPLLWQVYDDPLANPPVFTDTIEWAFVPDASEANFATPEATAFRTLVRADGILGERPVAGRIGVSPIIVYLVVDFTGKPAQTYTTDAIVIDLVRQ